MPVSSITGNYDEDVPNLIVIMNDISKLINEDKIVRASLLIDLIIDEMEELGLNLNENKEKYYYDVWKLMSKKFSTKKTCRHFA